MSVETSLLQFIHTQAFDDDIADIPLTDDDIRELQAAIQRDVDVGVLIRGSGGVRKVRVAVKGRGTRCGARVLYWVYRRRVAFLLFAYDKSETTSTSPQGRAVMRSLIRTLNAERSELE